MEQENDFGVEDTNEEALASKVSAIRKGYFRDDFAQEFVQYNGKRDIIIHRGYWARVYIVRNLVESMIKNSSQVQIVSLGCGLETLWFNLVSDQNFANKKFTFVELDLPNVVKRKIGKIQKSQKIRQLFTKLGDEVKVNQEKTTLSYGNKYKLAACDLSVVEQFEQTLINIGLDSKVPTLFYCECVLSYIDPDKVDNLLRFIHQKFDLSFVFDYEMYNPEDRFGQMMVKNFDQRGCSLVGIHKYPHLKDQETRFVNAGFQKNEVFTMKDIYYDCIPKEDRLNIEKIQMLDELEQWNIIMAHYFALLSTGWNEAGSQHSDFGNLTSNLRFKK